MVIAVQDVKKKDINVKIIKSLDLLREIIQSIEKKEEDKK
jgi:hypothetical protein